jgi:hypothetical protein
MCVCVRACVRVWNFKDELSIWKYSHVSNFVSFEELILLAADKFGADVVAIGGRYVVSWLLVVVVVFLVIAEAASVLLAT